MESPPSQLDIDVVIRVLSKTLFSPSFCLLAPLTILSQVKTKEHPAFIITLAWTACICLFSLLRHANRIYSSQGSWWFAPPKLVWGDQIVLITGGGSGIGALLAETLALRSVQVVVLTKDLPNPPTDNDNIATYVCDVSNYEEVMAVSRKVREEVGDPTIIVNNAGIVKGKLLLDLTENDIRDTFGANTLAQFWVLKAFLPALIKRQAGHIITMSSILGLVGAAQMTDYCASKAALVSLHQTLRFELDNRHNVPGVRTTLVLPAHIMTSLFAQIHFPKSRWFNFLAPSLHPHTIVKEIIDTLDAQESRILRLPWYSNLARFMGPGLGIMPKPLTDLIQWVSGADHAMAEYGPKPDAAQRLRAEKEP